jgi:plasmid stabilization system protein ParE
VKVRWTRPALDDLLAIFRYVARDSPEAAFRLRDRLREATAPLAVHPRIGRVVPEVGHESVREIVRGNYRIQYRVAEEVHVVAVVEGHREVSAESP